MAFGGFNSDEDGEMSEINVTPLVDVMLVLLIVFMLAMPVFTSSINVQLPTSTAEKPLVAPKVIRLTIDKSASYYLNDQEFSFTSLEQQLRADFQADPNAVITIRADKEVAYEAVIQLLEACRKIGFSKVGFVTEKK